LYVVEELVVQGDQQRWAQSIALEVVSGRRGAAQVRPARNYAASRDFHANKLLV
jgi:hypothetical protein